jgi:hypothetical protein
MICSETSFTPVLDRITHVRPRPLGRPCGVLVLTSGLRKLWPPKQHFLAPRAQYVKRSRSSDGPRIGFGKGLSSGGVVSRVGGVYGSADVYPFSTYLCKAPSMNNLNSSAKLRGCGTLIMASLGTLESRVVVSSCPVLG